jgi:hypothetical protein
VLTFFVILSFVEFGSKYDFSLKLTSSLEFSPKYS